MSFLVVGLSWIWQLSVGCFLLGLLDLLFAAVGLRVYCLVLVNSVVYINLIVFVVVWLNCAVFVSLFMMVVISCT